MKRNRRLSTENLNPRVLRRMIYNAVNNSAVCASQSRIVSQEVECGASGAISQSPEPTSNSPPGHNTEVLSAPYENEILLPDGESSAVAMGHCEAEVCLNSFCEAVTCSCSLSQNLTKSDNLGSQYLATCSCGSTSRNSSTTPPAVNTHCDDNIFLASEVGAEDNCFEEFILASDECLRCRECVCMLSCGSCLHVVDGVCSHCLKCGTADAENFSESESDDSNDEQDQQPLLKDDLRNWAVDNNVTHKQLRDLLAILRFHHPDDQLPKDPRSLIGTPQTTEIDECSPGSYWHNGLQKELVTRYSDKDPQMLELTFNVDGLPISASSASSLWPISCCVKGSADVFVVGIYHGSSKPDNVNEYLKSLVDECVDLCVNGLICGDKFFPVRVSYFCCDAPAKAFILQVKGHNAYTGCCRCTVNGIYFKNRMCYTDINCEKRTDLSFREQTQKEHHRGHSDLERIPNFDMVLGMVVDYMHAMCLGVMKKLLLLWLFGKLSCRIGNRMTQEISLRLTQVRQSIPVEFVRKPRPLDYLKRFKATELRQILLYTGPTVFYCMKETTAYSNFMVLHVASRILASPEYCCTFNDYADSLLKNFIEGFQLLYGKEFVNHNVHSLSHIAGDVLTYGPLDAFSAFKFENFMQHFKKNIRKGDKPLQQIARRYCEKSFARQREQVREQSKQGQFSGEHSIGVLISDCRSPQYHTYHLSDRIIICTKREADSCVLLNDGSVALIKNFAFHPSSKSIVAIGCKYLHVNDFFSVPCPSSCLNIFKVYGLSGLRMWPVEGIKTKYVRLPLKDNFIVYPLLHQAE